MLHEEVFIAPFLKVRIIPLIMTITRLLQRLMKMYSILIIQVRRRKI